MAGRQAVPVESNLTQLPSRGDRIPSLNGEPTLSAGALLLRLNIGPPSAVVVPPPQEQNCKPL